MFRFKTLTAVFGAALLLACNGDEPTDTSVVGDTDTDTDTDTDADLDAGDTLETAKNVNMTYNEWVTVVDAIGEGGDKDFFKITALAGNWYVFWAASATQGEGKPDTVIRVYDDSGAPVGEIDDMPWRIFGTDAASIWVPEVDGDYYVEVLEWSDWAEDGALGDPGWTYQMRFLETAFDEIQNPNDTAADTLVDGGFLWANPFEDGFPYMMPGTFDDPGDVDYHRYPVIGEDGSLCQFALWHQSPTPADVTLKVFHEDCTPNPDDGGAGDCTGTELVLLGETSGESAFTQPGGRLLPEDGGIAAEGSPGMYYVEVSETGGASGVGYYYPMFMTCYVTTFYVQEIESGTTEVGDATTLPMEPDTDGISSEPFRGTFDSMGGAADTFDVWRIGGGLVAGNTLDVVVRAGSFGSTAGQLTLTLWREVGGNLVQVKQEVGIDPFFDDYVITEDDFNLFVSVESDGLSQGPSAHYLGYTRIDPAE